MEIREFRVADYGEAYELWKASPGVGLSDADSRESIERFLERNPLCSSVAREQGRLVATALAGHDGRRGYLYHVAVHPDWRRRGIGRAVAARSLERLAAAGIRRCHLFIFADNTSGQRFWSSLGWRERPDIKICSRDLTAPG